MWLIAAGMAVAGILHLWIIPEHWQHAPAHGMIFLLLGITQLVWAVFFLRNNSSKMQTTGIILAAGSIFLWSLTRIFPAPFEDAPEALSVSGIIVKFSELVSAVGLMRIRARASRSMGIQAILAFLIALAIYISGKAVEPLFHHDMDEKHPHEHHSH